MSVTTLHPEALRDRHDSVKMRVTLKLAVVWTEVPAYLTACLKALASRVDLDLMLISDLPPRPASKAKHFDARLFSWISQYYVVSDRSAKKRWKAIQPLLRDFAPDVLLFAFQWRCRESYAIAREAHKLGALVIGTMDNVWMGSFRQHILSAIFRVTRILPLDALWVPGEGAASYGRRLFGARLPIWRGLYCADDSLFNDENLSRAGRSTECVRNGFLYVGRFSEEKGILDLITAYQAYRARVSEPWKLICVGSGPEGERLKGLPGVEVRPFAQPRDVAQLMMSSGVFVLPSTFEPWGVVIHEAALMGMAIVCTNACGAAERFVQDGINGFVYQAGDRSQLTETLIKMHFSAQQLIDFGKNSAKLAATLTTATWADQLGHAITSMSFPARSQQR
jgi:glycosyltransferase involved in cell wall biosynthesis